MILRGKKMLDIYGAWGYNIPVVARERRWGPSKRHNAILENDIEKRVRRKKETVRFRNELNAFLRVGACEDDKD